MFHNRSTRESTPCNSIKDMNVICTPGSSTRPRNLEAYNRINENSVSMIMPLAHEIEEFFARHEQEQQRRFADKYDTLTFLMGQNGFSKTGPFKNTILANISITIMKATILAIIVLNSKYE